MAWFHVALVGGLIGVLAWTLGQISGILIMMERGVDMQAMEWDPNKNGTMTAYVFILIFQFLQMGFCLFGLAICVLVFRNKYQMDHKLRHLFVIWIACWVCALFGNMGISIYALVRNKDPQGQMGIMYEMFQKGALNTKFIATFERFQRENSCCGIYGPDDWLMIQLRNSPGGMGMQSMDYGFQQNPGSGKCHMIPPTIPPGCGHALLRTIIIILNMYAALTITLAVLAAIVGVLAWYCFFYWLEVEVIVIPEDEVSNIIVVEPEDSSDSETSQRSYVSPPRSARYLRSGDLGRSARYLRSGDLGRSARYLAPGSYIRHQGTVYPISQISNRDRERIRSRPTIVVTRPSRRQTYLGAGSRTTNYDRYPNSHTTRYDYRPDPSRAQNTHSRIPNRTEQYLNPGRTHAYLSGSHHHNHHEFDDDPPKEEPPHHLTALEKQEKALGGHLLAEMHVDHKLDTGKSHIEQRAQGSKSKHKAHHATIAIVRNKHKNDPKPEPMANHGHTGNLAEDIADMSGGKALGLIDDVYIPVSDHPGHHKPKDKDKKTSVVSVGSVTGNRAQNTLEDVMLPEHLKKQKKANEKGTTADKNLLVHPHYLPGMTPKPSKTAPHHHEQEHEHPHGGYLGPAHEHDHPHGGYLGPAHEHDHPHGGYLGPAHEHEHPHGGYLGPAHEHEHDHPHGGYLGPAHEHEHENHPHGGYLGSHEHNHPHGGYLGSHEHNHPHGGYLGSSHEPEHHHEHGGYLGPSHEHEHHEHEHDHGHHPHGGYLGSHHHHPEHTVPFLGPPVNYVPSNVVPPHHVEHEREHEHDHGHNHEHRSRSRSHSHSRSRGHSHSHVPTKILFKNPNAVEDNSD